jgi:hypothetical protein
MRASFQQRRQSLCMEARKFTTPFKHDMKCGIFLRKPEIGFCASATHVARRESCV